MGAIYCFVNSFPVRSAGEVKFQSLEAGHKGVSQSTLCLEEKKQNNEEYLINFD
jgi:hypothetical protein